MKKKKKKKLELKGLKQLHLLCFCIIIWQFGIFNIKFEFINIREFSVIQIYFVPISQNRNF